MAYRIDPTQPTDQEIRRALGEQLGGGARRLRTPGGPDARQVHQVRKSIKKARSLLRLARGDLGPNVVRHAQAELRAAAGDLALQRDADSLVETAERLAAAALTHDDETRGAVDELGQQLVERAEAIRSGGGIARSRVLGAARSLEGVVAWLDRVPPNAVGWKALRPGFRRQYERGREAYLALGGDPTVHDLHEWRKRVKDLWYHQRLLRDLWPEAQDPIVAAASDLADALGDDHDLGVLVARLTGDVADTGIDPGEPPIAEIAPDALEAVLALADEERDRLLTEARLLGGHLYADEAKAWTDRHGAWWRNAAWDAEHESGAGGGEAGHGGATGGTAADDDSDDDDPAGSDDPAPREGGDPTTPDDSDPATSDEGDPATPGADSMWPTLS